MFLSARLSVFFPVLLLANSVTVEDLLAICAPHCDVNFATFSALAFHLRARILEEEI